MKNKNVLFIAVLLLSFMTVSSQSIDGKMRQVTSAMVSRIDADVQLTVSQKQKYESQIALYLTRLKMASETTNVETARQIRLDAYNEYKSSLDSLLTTDQKQMMLAKQEARIKALAKNTNR